MEKLMLTKFAVKNFKSFKNKTIVTLEKTKSAILEATNISSDDILKGSFFVGGNATGKTNLILALDFLLKILFAENSNLLKFYRCLYIPDPVMELEYEFLIDHSKIKFKIEYNFDQSIMKEILSIDDKEVISRLGNTGQAEIGEKKFYQDLSSEHLLTRELYFNTKFRESPLLQKWFQFLENSVYINPHKDSITCAGMVSSNLIDYLNDNNVNEINNFFQKFSFDQRIEYTKESAGKHFTIGSNVDQNLVFFKRNGSSCPIPYPLESLGNQNMVKILPQYLNVIKNGGMLIIDEFSSGFHNKLEELLIKYFMENTDKAQIFVVSHSTNLLSNSIFRPDQIYTVDFDINNGSNIHRVSDQKPREAQNLEKMYLSGVFDGIPRYSDDI